MARKTIVIGLTGSIGVGKSTACGMFKKHGFSVFSADEAVHRLCAEKGDATPLIAKHFPEAFSARGLDRKKLAEIVLFDDEKLALLEKLLHPLVFRACRDFVAQEKKKKAKGVVLEVPLLFETGCASKCDFTVCVSATAAVQKERVLKRKGMTEKKLRAILKRQMADREKRARADFTLRSDKGLAAMEQQIEDLCRTLFHEG